MNITIKKSGITAVINTKGAELISLKRNNKREYIWEGNPLYWGKHSPVLFPIVGTLKNDSYTYNDNKYHLMRHGFARDMNFELITLEENKATFSLKANDETKKVYPFLFELQLIYTLDESKLTIEYKIINNDDVKLPFSIGAHPAFALPLNFNTYSLQFEHSEELISYQLENNLLSDTTFKINSDENKVSLDYSLFENDALIFKQLKSKSIIILEDNNPLLKVIFNDFENLGIWTIKNAPFICIEPWLGYSDIVNASGNLYEKEGIQILDANKEFNCSFIIELY